MASAFWVPACSSRSPGQHCHLGQPSREFSVFSSRLAAAGIARSCFSARRNSASLSLSAERWVKFGSFGILAGFLCVRIRVPRALHAAVGLLWNFWSFLDSSCPLRACLLLQRRLLSRPFLNNRNLRVCPLLLRGPLTRLLPNQFLNPSLCLRVCLPLLRGPLTRLLLNQLLNQFHCLRVCLLLLRGPLARLLPNHSSVNFVVFVCVFFCCAVHWPGFSQIIPQSISSSPPAPLSAARSGVLPQPSCVFFSQPNRQCGLLALPSHQSESPFVLHFFAEHFRGNVIGQFPSPLHQTGSVSIVE